MGERGCRLSGLGPRAAGLKAGRSGAADEVGGGGGGGTCEVGECCPSVVPFLA